VPASGGQTERQLRLILDFAPDVLHCTPTYALTLAHEFEKRGVEPDEISLRFAILGAEPWTEAMRNEIDAGLGVSSSNLYGLSEIVGPGVSCECVEVRDGNHVNEDHFLVEVVDPETHEPLAEGDVGVLVFTTLTKEAIPVVRYWTGDLASLSSGTCACGRTFTKMGRVLGRTDDMLIIRGVNVFPSQVEEVLGRIDELAPHYQLVLSRTGTLDEVEVHTELTVEFHRTIGVEQLTEEVIDGHDTLRAVRQRTSELIKESIGSTMKVRLVGPGSVPRSDGGKLSRVVDRRPGASA
jgi:phenylacetate-CoA ligase